MTSLMNSLYNAVVSFPDFEQVTTTLANSFAESSTVLFTRGPNDPDDSSKHKYTLGNNPPDIAMPQFTVYDRLNLLRSFFLLIHFSILFPRVFYHSWTYTDSPSDRYWWWVEALIFWRLPSFAYKNFSLLPGPLSLYCVPCGWFTW